MAYLPKTNAAKEIYPLMSEISTAQDQWGTYATQLGRGYTAAYQEHEKAIDKVNRNIRLQEEKSYWLLSLLCVGFAGGLIGGLMAPWVKNAGTSLAQQIMRTTTSKAT